MHIDIEFYLMDEKGREHLLAEAVIQYISNGYIVDAEEIREHFSTAKIREKIKRYMNDGAQCANAQGGGRTVFGTCQLSIGGAFAQQTSLAEKCLDVITVASAYHYFDNDAARKEFRRVLKRKPVLCLISLRKMDCWKQKLRQFAFMDN